MGLKRNERQYFHQRKEKIMKELLLSTNQFQFEQFASDILKFLARRGYEDIDPSSAIARTKSLDDIPEFGSESGRDNFLEELNQGYYLFFPFSDSDVGEPIRCADGEEYEIDEESDFSLGEVACVGFLLKIEGDRIRINSAVHDCGGCPLPPSVEIRHCDVFDSPMNDFIHRYIGE